MAAVVAIGMAGAVERAQACGGCFAPTDTVTTVDSHRMVIALSPAKTVLWDQIRYTGNPRDFVWVLPVPSSDATVEVANAEFFDVLDAWTAPRVQPKTPPPNLFCPESGGVGCGSGGDDDDTLQSGGGADAGVTVFHEGVVGPYETVTIGSEDAGALQAWLTAHGYGIPAETVPTLMHYITQKSVFVVLRLQPNQGVQAMQPVRVTYPGYMATFPLKMVTVGAAGALGLSLWVFADQRYEARNYGTIAINEAELSYDWQLRRSNYDAVFAATIERGGGRAWIVEFAQPLSAAPLPVTAEAAVELRIIAEAIRAPYLTRLRTRVLAEHLNQDLELTPSVATANIDSLLVAPTDVNYPAPVKCPDDDSGACALGASRRLRVTATPIFLGLAALALIRLRARRRPRQR